MFAIKKRFFSIEILFLIIISLSLLSAFPVSAQDECTQKLQQAKDFYDQGLIEDIPGLLIPCMDEGFSRAQRIEAYKLLILAYLFDNDQASAEATMMDFLKKFPEYELLPNDPAEFVYLFQSYRTTSVYSVGITAGFNITDPRIMESYSALDLSNTSFDNKMKGGFQLGIGLARYLSFRTLLNAELLFSRHQYEFVDAFSTFSEGVEIINNVTYNEKLYKADIPVSLTYELISRKIHYYIRGGVQLSVITGARGQASRLYAREAPPFTGEPLTMMQFRQKILYSGVTGAGIMFKVPRGMITLDFRAILGLNNIVNKKERYNNPMLSSRFNYLDDDFSLNVFNVSAGYYFSFYTPSKQR
jgi:hypothetical protein